MEGATGITYKDFVQQYIVDPLGMYSSSCSLSEYTAEEKGKLYEDGNPIPDYHLITYPDGGFVTSLFDFTKYFHSILRGYYGESNMITADSYRTMMTAHFSEGSRGVGIFMELDGDLIGHTGGDPGVNTFALFDRDSSYGYILFFKNGFSTAMINTMIEVRKATAHLIVQN